MLAWAGTGIVWSVAGGVPRSLGLGGTALAAPAGGFSFVQISDSHIGFKADANPIRTRPCRPRSTRSDTAAEARDDDPYRRRHPSLEAEQFDTADQIIKPRRSIRISSPASTT